MVGRAQHGRWPLPLVALLALVLLPGCASFRTLNSKQPNVPLIYSGTRLNWYALHDGCCAKERFGAQAPKHAAIDLPASVLLDTLVLPFTVAAELGVNLGIRGGM
ncbi:YceK/YidQ family lipoprotein [Azomonas macrocytogenes]|uniref:YceK/YidQ family lipoprotein n=1 Tax=Azomonas macrocytogenes TaxID=69962 RepID=UPI003B82FEB2